MRSHTVVDSPIGLLTVVDDDGALAALYQTDQRHLPPSPALGARDDSVQPAAREQLAAYFRRELREFDLPLAAGGTPFQEAVWAALREIPYGTTCTYADVARAIGRPTACRAVGAANGRNPIGIVVPCHRVVGSGGSLTGYAGGLPHKQRLLDLERGVDPLL
jgi:methylated-DNA-[protein]-cysteine S-methyltransferase